MISVLLWAVRMVYGLGSFSKEDLILDCLFVCISARDALGCIVYSSCRRGGWKHPDGAMLLRLTLH